MGMPIKKKYRKQPGMIMGKDQSSLCAAFLISVFKNQSTHSNITNMLPLRLTVGSTDLIQCFFQ